VQNGAFRAYHEAMISMLLATLPQKEPIVLGGALLVTGVLAGLGVIR
jgi:hypothetical protein